MIINQQASFDKFKKELNYCYEKVPFYKKHLDSAGARPDSIHAIRDIINLPFTEKKHYRKNFPLGVLAQGYKPNDPRLTRSQSSGTTGERLVTVEAGILLLNRAIKCARVNPSINKALSNYVKKTCRYAAPNCSDVECANPNSTMQDRILDDGTLVLPVYHDLLTTSEELIARALEEVCDYQPDLYYIDPTHFAFLARQAKSRGISLPDAPVMATYTGPTLCARRQIKAAFDGKRSVIELLASSEMGWIGMECPHGRLHLNTDSFFLEVIRDGEYAELGESGELYITSLDKGALPHIRYKTGDAVKLLDEQCPCGNPLPVAAMQGRMMNFIKQNNRYIASPYEIDQLIGAPAWLDQYQCHQIDENSVVLKIIVNDDYQPEQGEKLAAEVKRFLGEGWSVQLEKLNYIATERSGKFHATKSDISTPTVFGEANAIA